MWHKHAQRLICVPENLTFSLLLFVTVFRRPEGKFKKKQNPRDEALQILRPQMDNPPAPQVGAHQNRLLISYSYLDILNS